MVLYQPNECSSLWCHRARIRRKGREKASLTSGRSVCQYGFTWSRYPNISPPSFRTDSISPVTAFSGKSGFPGVSRIEITISLVASHVWRARVDAWPRLRCTDITSAS